MPSHYQNQWWISSLEQNLISWSEGVKADGMYRKGLKKQLPLTLAWWNFLISQSGSRNFLIINLIKKKNKKKFFKAYKVFHMKNNFMIRKLDGHQVLKQKWGKLCLSIYILLMSLCRTTPGVHVLWPYHSHLTWMPSDERGTWKEYLVFREVLMGFHLNLVQYVLIL